MTPMHCQHKRKKYKKKLHNSQFIKNYFLQFIQSNNYYGGNGMYQYKFSDEDEKRILEQIDSTNNKKESDTSLSDQFSQIDNKYYEKHQNICIPWRIVFQLLSFIIFFNIFNIIKCQ